MSAIRDALTAAGLPVDPPRMRDWLTHGLLSITRRPVVTNSRLTPDDVRAIRVCFRLGMASGDIADEFGVSKSAIEKIRYGISWTHVTAEETAA